jgi:hypothetical protein
MVTYCVLTLGVQDEFSHLVQQWNIQRNSAVERAITKLLYPQMEKELRAKLLLEAQEGIIKVGQRSGVKGQGSPSCCIPGWRN